MDGFNLSVEQNSLKPVLNSTMLSEGGREIADTSEKSEIKRIFNRNVVYIKCTIQIANS